MKLVTDNPGAAENSRAESPFQGSSCARSPWWELEGAAPEPLELQRVAVVGEAGNDLESGEVA